MGGKAGKRLIWLGVGGIAVGACVYLVGQTGDYLDARGLDDADKIAGVVGMYIGAASFVATVIGLVLTWLALRRDRQDSAQVSTPASPPVAGATLPEEQFEHDLAVVREVANIDHDQLFGVAAELDALDQALRNPNGDWLISIWGGPGTGKTALAYDLIKIHARRAGFARIAAASARFASIDLVGNLENRKLRAALDWRDLLVDIARQLAPEFDFTADLIEKQFPGALPKEPCLILIDNLETMQEAELAVRYLATRGITDPHKVVLTTRESVGGFGIRGLKERSWNGPNAADAYAYASHLAGEDATLAPTRHDLDDVVAAAERAPLLIQIIIHQAREARISIREVIQRLRDKNQILGSSVWSYCYVHSLNVLADRVGLDSTAKLMSVFCSRPAGASFTSEAFFQHSGIPSRELFHQARALACGLSLVRSMAGNTRFTVHSLLREFYCTSETP